jgi:class 3 adenylate cyclase/WD40 repeat protein/tRNA A-37 threonylcarbamoyl transferase component Bud32
MSGPRIAERYEPIETVGRGGEATVVKAVDTRHGRLVALKVRPAHDDGSDELLAEARTLLSLPPHPGLAHARDDLFDRGRHVLVLDWVEGVDLARVQAESVRPGLPVSSVLRWVAQAAEALSVLHDHDVVHGDVKPANLVLDRSGRVVVVDLGSSSVPSPFGSSSSRGGGTPGFRAPEVAGGSPPTPASDVFSLAATAFALLTGSPPTGVAPTWVGLPIEASSRLEAAVRAGLAIDPARRPSSPGAFVELLRAGWGDATPTGVGTVMRTGVVGSSQLWERQPRNAPGLLTRLELDVDRTVEDHEGRRVGATVEGDTSCSTFASAADAVRAAVALQRLVRGRDIAIGVRIGLATGELVVGDSGGVLGPTVNRATRVRDLARVGEVLLSSTTAALIRPAPPDGTSLLSLGEHRLRDLDGLDEIAAVVAEGVAAPPDPARSPYPGLEPFTIVDADLYVGREDAVSRATELLERHGFVAVVGASGSGKTSLALAGIARRAERFVVVRPGSHPLLALAEVGLDERAGVTLVVDQLEELITLCADEGERAAFVDAVLARAGDVVVTMRADLYGELGRYTELAERVAASQVLLGPMEERDLVRAVEEPALRCGLEVEAGLAEVIARELGTAPGTLPLLGHALRETWRRRDGRTITLAAYRASGGVSSAISSTADRALAALDEGERRAARALLLRMVELRVDGDDARRWADRHELLEIEPERGSHVIASLADARLVVADGEQVTVVHEALLRAWPTLHGWIAVERGDLLARQELRSATARWQAGGRAEADVYRGVRLDAAIELAGRARLPTAEAEFVDAGRRVREVEIADHRRRTRRLRVLAGAASAMALIAVVVGAVAVVQRNDAQEARVQADQEATRADDAAAEAVEAATAADDAAAEAESDRAAAEVSARKAQIEALVGRAESMRATQRDTAALLAAQAYLLADTATTRSALLSTFTDGDGFLDARRLDGTASAEGGTGIVLPDGETAYVTGADGRLRPYDLDTGHVGAPWSSLTDMPDVHPGLTVSADGDLLAQFAWQGRLAEGASTRLAIFDTAVGALRFPPITVAGGSSDGAFSADGSTLSVVVYPDAHVISFDTATGEQIATAPGLEVPADSWRPADITTVGDQLVVVADRPSVIRVLDARSLELRSAIDLPESTSTFVFPVGDHTVIASGPQGVVRVDVMAREVVWHQLTQDSCGYAVVDAARERLFCADFFGRLEVRDLNTGLVVERRSAQNGNAGPLHLASGGRELVAFGVNEPVVSRWRLDGSGPITRLVAPGYDPKAFSPDGRSLAVERGLFGVDYVSRVVDPTTGDLVRDLDGLLGTAWIDDDTVGGAAFRADGTVGLALMDLDVGELVFDDLEFDPVPSWAESTFGKELGLLVYDDAAGSSVRTLTTDGLLGPLFDVGPINTVTIDRSGEIVVASSADGRGIVFYDAATGVEVDRIPGATQGAFVTQTDQLFITSLGGELTQHELDTFEPVRTFGGSRGYIQRVFATADGSLIVANGGDRSVSVFDVATGVRLGTPLAIPDVSYNFVSLAPSGSAMALRGDEGVLVWDLDPARWLEGACQVAGRNLTRAEWATNIGELAPYAATCPEFPLGATP